MFQGFQKGCFISKTHAWMNGAYAHVMQVQMRQGNTKTCCICFKSMFQGFQKGCFISKTHAWMNDTYAHVMQVQMRQGNTKGVTALPPYKNLILRFGKCTVH
jgi:hypothetical protein